MRWQGPRPRSRWRCSASRAALRPRRSPSSASRTFWVTGWCGRGVGHGLYDEFCAGFPYEETEDQRASIDAVLDDLNAGRPMDRLVCGDVGFGKTEVALRAAFATAMNGKQVAVVVPTTLLARQHTKTFTERFHGFPIKIGQASRLVSTKELAQVRKGLAEGQTD